jgi:3-carboxy-cis,cis-muconate cycloisomerase
LLAAELGLPLPDLPWHAERDRIALIASALGTVAGAMLKIAGDIVLMSQTEVGEVSEGATDFGFWILDFGPGAGANPKSKIQNPKSKKGGSSAMPHKHNPVDATMARAAARQAVSLVPLVLGAMDAEHERAAGSWQLEWGVIPTLFCSVAAAVAHVKNALRSLDIDADRMRANLDQAGGLLMAESVMMALAPHFGRPEAQRLVQAASERVASRRGGSRGSLRSRPPTFRQALLQDERIKSALSTAQIESALDPAAYLGSTDVWIDRALETYRGLLGDMR